MHTFTYGQNYPTDFAQVLVANAIANPTAMAFAPDGRIFVAEQGGRLRVIKNGTLLPTPFVQLTVSSTGERGLIGITLDQDFANNQHIYLYYTVPGSPPHNRVSRFTANGDVVMAGSEAIILNLDPLSNATNHNGGAMHFGKDGKLYIAVGENANSAHAQNLDTYHGKILRINKDGTAPVDNPFPTGSEQRKRVWSYGLRNPFTFSIHPETGRMLINDVGQVSWEEVNDATEPGKNFGWPTTEGKFNAATFPALTNPIYAYPRAAGDGNGCAITGGVFYYPESTNYPSTYFGKYFIQDFCNRWINFLDVSTTVASRLSFATSIATSGVALSVGRDGNLYYLSRGAGALYKIIYNETTIPYITEHPLSLTVAEGEAVTFAVSVLGSTPLEYQWEKDGTEILNATDATYFINASPADEGDYRVVVSNDAGNTISNIATLSVISNALPTASIISPLDSSLYTAGTAISFSGAGTDPEDGELPPNAFTWQVDFHHDTHKHDQPPTPGVVNGSFFVPDEGETSDNVWYTILLTVTDSKGSMAKDSVTILPRKSVISLTTDPPGLEILVDGQPFSTPVEIISVEGMKTSFSVASPQVVDGKEFEFEAWSNKGEINQTLTTPMQDTSLAARFAIILSTENTDTNVGDVILFPNPVTEGFCTVQFAVAEAQEVSIRLVNILAQEVFAVTESLAAGAHSVLINARQASPGIYYLMINANGRQIARRLIVARQN
jgi:glucose/arabinose dehydrogenase